MTQRRKALLISVILAAVGLGAVIVLIQTNKPQTSRSDETASYRSNNPAKPLKAPDNAPVNNDAFVKQACDLLDEQLAKKTVGDGAVKNETLSSLTSTDYSSTGCEYADGSKKVNVMLYRYDSEERAKSNKKTVQKQITAASPDGKTTSVQPRQSVAKQKGKFLVSVSVTSGNTFDAVRANKLLEEIVGKV